MVGRKSRGDFCERLGQDELNGMWSHKVLSDIRHQVSCVVCDVCKENVGDSREGISNEQYRVSTASKKRLYCFQLKRGLSIADHMNNYTKLLIR